MNNYDNIEPAEKWIFDEKVADCFENMLERSIPQYQVMREAVTDIVYSIIKEQGKKTTSYNILDIGCSDGIMLENIVKRFSKEENICDAGEYTGNCGRYLGVDISKPMLTKAKHRLLEEVISHQVKIDYCDLRCDFPNGLFNVITSILTIQFTPIEYRQQIIQNIYDSLVNKYSCFIMVEKVLGNTNRLNELFVKEYYKKKAENGYSQEQIERKRLSLEGVLVPVTNDWNIDLLRQAGFREVDVFWRWMNFVGYIAFK